MDSVAVTLSRLISEASKQSPQSGNGFGFGMAIMVCVCIVCVVGIVLRERQVIVDRKRQDKYREQQLQNEREDRANASTALKLEIGNRFDKLEQQTEKAIARIEAESKGDANTIADLDRRISRIEIRMEN